MSEFSEKLSRRIFIICAVIVVRGAAIQTWCLKLALHLHSSPPFASMQKQTSLSVTDIVREIQDRNVSNYIPVVDDLDGILAVGETVTGYVKRNRDRRVGVTAVFANITSAPAYTLGAISEFITGVNGLMDDAFRDVFEGDASILMCRAGRTASTL